MSRKCAPFTWTALTGSLHTGAVKKNASLLCISSLSCLQYNLKILCEQICMPYTDLPSCHPQRAHIHPNEQLLSTLKEDVTEITQTQRTNLLGTACKDESVTCQKVYQTINYKDLFIFYFMKWRNGTLFNVNTFIKMILTIQVFSPIVVIHYIKKQVPLGSLLTGRGVFCCKWWPMVCHIKYAGFQSFTNYFKDYFEKHWHFYKYSFGYKKTSVGGLITLSWWKRCCQILVPYPHDCYQKGMACSGLPLQKKVYLEHNLLHSRLRLESELRVLLAYLESFCFWNHKLRIYSSFTSNLCSFVK